MTNRQVVPARLLVVLPWALTACVGAVSPAPAAPTRETPTAAGMSDPVVGPPPIRPSPPDPAPSCAATLPPPGLRLRSEGELRRSALDWLTWLGLSGVPVQSQADTYDSDAVPGQHLSAPTYLAHADASRRLAIASVPELSMRLGCKGGSVDAPCVEAFVGRAVPRAFRRRLVAAEVAALMEVFRAGDTPVAGLGLVVEAVLNAPSFMYRTELGAQATGEVALTPHERAGLLASFLLGSIPDDGLWSAAESGALARPEGLAAEVTRLLAGPRARRRLTGLLLRWSHADAVLGAEKDGKSFPGFDATVRATLLAESERFIDELSWRRAGKTAELLTAAYTFVDARTAPLYGVTYPRGASGLVELPLPAGQRSGLLTHGAVLAALAGPRDTSVVHRGLFVRERVLCLPPPPPPGPEVQQAVTEQTSSARTERAKADQRAGNAQCGGCHALIDPLGLVLESYDAVGRFRTKLPTSEAIDPSVTLSLGDGLDGRVRDAPDLGGRLAASALFSRCLTAQVMGAAIAEAVAADGCAVKDVVAQAGGAEARLADLLRATLSSPALYSRSKGESR